MEETVIRKEYTMTSIDILSLAKKHAIRRELAAPDFFEGALLGNGGLGVVVCTRPDGIVIHLGHNDIWDIRIEEGHKDAIGTFEEVWSRICAAPGDVHQEQWYKDYEQAVTRSYLCYKYPRPYPAGTMYLFFDRKGYEVLGHELDISRGLLTVTLLNSEDERYHVEIFVSQSADTVYCRTTDEAGREVPIFDRLRLVPNEPDEGLPPYEGEADGFFQLLPYNDYAGVPRPGVDKAFSVRFFTKGGPGPKTKVTGISKLTNLREKVSGVTQVTVCLKEGDLEQVRAHRPDPALWEDALREAEAVWQEYWERSGVRLEDSFLEELWYRNTYFLRCLLSGSSRCPGLFGNWMYGDVGTAWHGDYHMNYNTQQIFWGLMAANRQELHMPYVRLAEELLPLSRSWAQDFYKLAGACFPHSAYPVPMTVMPYPSPDWGWEIFETPWTVQSLWWHYTYTKDKQLLKTRLYPVLREAAVFLAEYMTRPGADPVGDGRYHLFPTIVPEIYGLTENFTKNLDGAVDLALTKFVFCAVLQAVEELDLEEDELTGKIRKILGAFPDYPTAASRFGEVYVSVATEDPDAVIYNCPANLMQIFPGEDVDAQTADPATLELARRSWRHHYNEGGNDLVFYYLIAARLRTLDLEKFKRHVRYCLLPNGTATDRVTLAGGRYYDDINCDFMSRMGIWVENFSLHAVVTESLLWGHGDTAVLFPNWDKRKPAAFTKLRTKGAFLVDAACSGGKVDFVRVTAEAGGVLKLEAPWEMAEDHLGRVYTGKTIEISMEPGEDLTLRETVR